MEATTKRKRIARHILVFTTNQTRVVDDLMKRMDQQKEENLRIQKELFPEPYRDWRTNEIIE